MPRLTKAKIPKEHYDFLRKVWRYLHFTQDTPDTNESLFQLSHELFSAYMSHWQALEDFLPASENSVETDDNSKPSQKSPLESLHQTVYQCTQCFLGERRKKVVILPPLPTQPIMVVTDIPSFYDETQGQYFTDEAGKLLIKIVESLGLAFKEIYHTGAIKCASSIEISNQLEKIQPCINHLLKEITIIKPTFIIAFGEDVFRFIRPQLQKSNSQGQFDFSEFENIRGKKLKLLDSFIVLTHHPRDLIYNPLLKKQVWEDLKPYKEFSAP